MAPLETLLSFVNTWECDENDHLNVQYYFAKFDEADRQFRQMTGFSETLVGSRRVRHVRYHAELRAATLVKVRSYAAFDGPHMFSVVHEMIEGSTGEIAATAIDGYTPNPSRAKTLRERFEKFEANLSEQATPRTISASPFSGKPTMEELLGNGAVVTSRASVLPRHLDSEYRAEDAFYLSCISDASSHAWERTPMTMAWLYEKDYGRVAVEQKLTTLSPLALGDMVAVVTSFTGVQGNTFNLRHHIFETKTNRLVAVCDMVALAMDLEKRSIVPLSEETKQQLHALQSM
ncbi:acyl-CoA thioesterase [Polycladidibacter stylochi]|uniref:acyl-CoA thioesterase n=1 Tax=Polycladidibacter stylochi TaxID=1807766 RepID=UPI00082FADCC|nr:thioesterase family protein [Pseudovibrio stylochi]